MNMDVPYYRLGSHEKVEYIPLKLALSDDEQQQHQHQHQQQQHAYGENDKIMMQTGEMNTAANNMSAGIIILISLVAFVALFVLLYVIYYFVILREQQQYSDNSNIGVF
ncbi:ORF-64 [Catopsilia pomona nucleopolyhedrovirus]|uniref:ORF-64 n=1 Tax=Catopsilia pomona nucleopolyhedrovirus TaxID=1850906 RepID=A0A172WZE3_9ABAC|nr:ORF-64 [Catopsilia pomona nucleopolyhedrovirus]ANF29712.1 ORF-64 [Catopsilia pomona nucleopolyhedrovirus]